MATRTPPGSVVKEGEASRHVSLLHAQERCSTARVFELAEKYVFSMCCTVLSVNTRVREYQKRTQTAALGVIHWVEARVSAIKWSAERQKVNTVEYPREKVCGQTTSPCEATAAECCRNRR